MMDLSIRKIELKKHPIGCFCFWQRDRDSNPNKQSQSLSCYRYTIPLGTSDIILSVFPNVNTKIQTIEIKNEKTYDVIEGNTRYLTISEIESLDCLMPFGEGFQEPLFYLEKMYVKGRKLLQNMHSKWSLEGGFEAMKFHSQAVKQSPNINTMTFIGTLQVSEFLNQKKINILVKEEFPCEL